MPESERPPMVTTDPRDPVTPLTADEAFAAAIVAALDTARQSDGAEAGLRGVTTDAIRLACNVAGPLLGHSGRFDDCQQPLCVRVRAALQAAPAVCRRRSGDANAEECGLPRGHAGPHAPWSLVEDAAPHQPDPLTPEELDWLPLVALHLDAGHDVNADEARRMLAIIDRLDRAYRVARGFIPAAPVSIDRERLEELRSLSRAASPGPWSLGRSTEAGAEWHPQVWPAFGAPIASADGRASGRSGAPHKDAADFAFIVAAVNYARDRLSHPDPVSGPSWDTETRRLVEQDGLPG